MSTWVASVEGTAPLSAQALVQQQDSVGLNSVPQYEEVLLSFFLGFTQQEAVRWFHPATCRPFRRFHEAFAVGTLV